MVCVRVVSFAMLHPWRCCVFKPRHLVTNLLGLFQVGVRFDYPLPGGTSLGGICEENHGYWCSVRDLRLEGCGNAEEAESAAIDALFDIAIDCAAQKPLIILLKVRLSLKFAYGNHSQKLRHASTVILCQSCQTIITGFV